MSGVLEPRIDSHAPPKMGSERSFGLIFAAAFAVIALLPLARAEKVRIWALAIAAVFLAAALMKPHVLAPLNRIWFRLGLLLGKIVTPAVMAVLWFVVVTPVGLLGRFFRKDPLRLKRELGAKSYWIERSPPGPAAGTLKRQF